MILEHTIRGPVQSGRTNLALGALERLQKQGVSVAYVVPTKEWAREAKKLTSVPCIAWIDAVTNPNKDWRAVAVDDLERCPTAGLDILRRTLSAKAGPTQLILVETSETPTVEANRPKTAREEL